MLTTIAPTLLRCSMHRSRIASLVFRYTRQATVCTSAPVLSDKPVPTKDSSAKKVPGEKDSTDHGILHRDLKNMHKPTHEDKVHLVNALIYDHVEDVPAHVSVKDMEKARKKVIFKNYGFVIGLSFVLMIIFDLTQRFWLKLEPIEAVDPDTDKDTT